MPRKTILSTSERQALLAVPDTQEELIGFYALSAEDLAAILQHRGAENRLGFAVQLCYMRYPGIILGLDEKPSQPLLGFVASQLKVDALCWAAYGRREQTRREHLVELQSTFGFKAFTMQDYRPAVQSLIDHALQVDKGIVIAMALVEHFRSKSILLPLLNVMDRICSEAITLANRRIYKRLTDWLTPAHQKKLDALLKRKENEKITLLAWLRQSPLKPKAKYLLQHIERLNAWRSIGLPAEMERQVHPNRLLKIAREGGQMAAADLEKFEPQRRYATLVVLTLEGTATVIDEIIDLFTRLNGKMHNDAKHKHAKQIQVSSKAINDSALNLTRICRALIEAEEQGVEWKSAILSQMPWDQFTAMVSEAETIIQPEDFDHLHLIGEGYSYMRRYAPQMLEVLHYRAAPAAKSLLDAIELLRDLNAETLRKLPADAPTDFIRKRWKALVITNGELDRRHYEICVLSELKNALRSGDIWVEGSRQFKDFDGYLLPLEKFEKLKQTQQIPLTITPDLETFLKQRIALLTDELTKVNALAASNQLPDAVIHQTGLKIAALDPISPDAAKALVYQVAALLPRIKITDMLLEVDQWTGFSRHFRHFKTGEPAKDIPLLLTTILADGINLGLTKMAESCPGSSYRKLAWVRSCHIRDETYCAATAELTNTQFRQNFAAHWGDGTTSSSDGQRFPSGGHAESTGHVNLKYGTEPGRMFYTHISDQYSPFNIKVINVGIRDSTYVLDGLLYHESDLRIAEHYTDTAGFTDHVFALMHLLDFRFAPRIRNLNDTKLYLPGNDKTYDALKPMIGGKINLKLIRTHWDEILRLATSIKQGTVTASLMLSKLGSYPRQNGLALALRELGRIERTLFILDWLQSPELRRRVNAGLNKGEARNSLARAVFFCRLGEIMDRDFEQQQHRASGLNLITSAIILWNTVYLERAVAALRANGKITDESLLGHLSPLGWEHIGLTGDYLWGGNPKIGPGKFRPLRPFPRA